jgi:hypothetical protein
MNKEEVIIIVEKQKEEVIYVVKILKEKINNPNVDTSTAFKLVSLAMEIIENYKTNENKKEIVILAFKELIKEVDTLLHPDITSILKPIVENELLLSGIIDVICMATKGEININKIKKKCCYCFI